MQSSRLELAVRLGRSKVGRPDEIPLKTSRAGRLSLPLLLAGLEAGQHHCYPCSVALCDGGCHLVEGALAGVIRWKQEEEERLSVLGQM